jgi:Rne/Rng family ribonuclease
MREADAPDEILIATEPARYRAAAVARGRLVDVMSVPRREAGGVGSIHLGRVVRRAAGMGAAFVEIGLDRPAFLNLGKDTPAEGKPAAVQIVEEAAGGKAARVATRLALEGRFAVLLPRDKGVAPSRRLDAAAARRLADLARPMLQAGEGLVLRAAAAHAARDDLAAELAALRALWQAIAAKLAGTPPVCAHAEHGLRRILCTFAGDPAARFVAADAETARLAQRLAATIAPDLAGRIAAADEGAALFDRHGVADALAIADGSEVALPSGGRLTIETTRALSAVDVDSGGGSMAAEAVLATNLEAADELARQLRLRELGGPVVVDFIRMQRKGDHDRVRRRLARAVASDRLPVQLLGWTPGGLFELARTRAGHA